MARPTCCGCLVSQADGWPLSEAIYAKQTREAPDHKQGHLFADSVALSFFPLEYTRHQCVSDVLTFAESESLVNFLGKRCDFSQRILWVRTMWKRYGRGDSIW